MSTNMIILLIVLGVAGGMAGDYFLQKFLAAKKIDLSAVEAKVDKVLEYLIKDAEAIAPFLPPKYSAIVDKIAKSVAAVVQKIEDLHNLNLVPADQRKAAATKLIIADLEAQHITVDENIQKLISAAIDSACLVLPHHVQAPATNAAANAAPVAK